MNMAEIRKTTEQKMQKSIEALKHDLAKIRTGRAHTGLLDHIQVDYYGSLVPINQVGQVGLGDARTITVQPFEKKMVPVIEKAIRDSDLGLNPASHGDVIRVPMPALTEERRKELTKVVRHEGENARVAVRNQRRGVDGERGELDRRRGVEAPRLALAELEVRALGHAERAVVAVMHDAGGHCHHGQHQNCGEHRAQQQSDGCEYQPDVAGERERCDRCCLAVQPPPSPIDFLGCREHRLGESRREIAPHRVVC